MALDHFYSWAWTPHQVYASDKAEQEKESILFLPDQATPYTGDAAIAHFSTLRDGAQHSWLWVFAERTEALSVRMLPSFLGEDDPVSTIISSSLPPNEPQKPLATYLQVVPIDWFLQWDLDEIQEVWLGFNYKQFILDRVLQSAAQVFSTEEFLAYVRRVR